MNNKEFNNKLNRAFKNSTPDILEDIIAECKAETQPNIMVLETKKRSNLMKKRIISIAAAFAVVITASAVGFNYFGNRSLAKISLDVNPSFEIDVNTREKVTEIEAKNDDAKKVLGDMDLEGSNIDVAVNALVGSIYKNGFLNEASNSVLISVDGDNSAELQERISKDVEGAVNGFEVAVLTQSITADDTLLAEAEQYGISVGKAKLVKTIMSKDANKSSFQDLANLSVNELNLIHKKLEGEDDIVSVGSASEKAYIGAGNAKKAALKAAGAKQSEVKYIKSDMDFEDGVMIYEIEFATKSAKYEYEVNAKDGSIVNFEVDEIATPENNKEDKKTNSTTSKKPNKPASNNNNNYNNNNNNNTTTTVTTPSKPSNNGGLISESKAKKIALNAAGVSSSNIFGYHIELDRDDGVVSYEIEFHSGNTEYKYDIHATTGEIISSEKDIDDDYKVSSKKTTSKTTSSKSSSTISKSKAKSIALNSAGLKASDIYGYEINYDNDDGLSVYEIEFKSGRTEYSFEINAKTGKIIDKEVDIDD